MRNDLIKNTILAVSLAINIAMAVILFTPLTERLYVPLIVDEPVHKSEAVVVLSGDNLPSGFPALKTLTRLRKGIELYHDRLASKIICLGGTMAGKTDKTIAIAMKEALVFYGIPPDDIIVQDETTNTYYDIKRLIEKYHEKFNFNNVAFVTSSFHTYRVKKVLEKLGMYSPVVSAEPYELYPNFWTMRLDLFSMVAREYMVIVYFKIKGWI